jgi:hypothetical protein
MQSSKINFLTQSKYQKETKQISYHTYTFSTNKCKQRSLSPSNSSYNLHSTLPNPHSNLHASLLVEETATSPVPYSLNPAPDL